MSKPRIVVVVEGGIVQNVLLDGVEAQGEYAVLDYDTEHADEDCICTVEGAEVYFGHIHETDHSQGDRINAVFRQFKR